MITFAEVTVGTGGTASCSLCAENVPRAFASADDITRDIAAAAAAWEHGPGPNIAFVGAEPFAHPELPALVDAAVSAGVQRIRLRTDGGALASGENAAGALFAGVRHLEVVLLGGQKAHDELTARPGLFEAARAGVSAFRDAADGGSAVPVAICGLVPVCLHTLEHAADAVAALASWGALAVRIDISSRVASSANARKWLAAAIETGTVAGVWVHVTGMAKSETPVSPLHAVSPSETLSAVAP